MGRLQRSLSGKFASGDESLLASFLQMVLGEVDDSAAASDEQKTTDSVKSEEEEILEKKAKRFLTKCRETFKAKNQQIQVGGAGVTRAVTSLFTSLVWHSQSLREELDRYLAGSESSDVPEGVMQAFSTAESVRLQLTGDRQKWNNLEDKSSDCDPAEVVAEKARFLLKFSGLTKVQLRQDLRGKLQKQKKPGNVKRAGAGAVIGVGGGMRSEVMERHPSFRLVMEFVQDPAWTTDRVHQLLQQRVQYATAVSEVFLYVSEMTRIMSQHSSPFQIPLVLYFREMFTYQDRFARHYAHGLEGCGLDLEAKVRLAYYGLVRRLVGIFRDCDMSTLESKRVPACDFLKTCLLHLLDVDWQPYDLNFVVDMQLPQLYMAIAKETVKMRDLKTSNTCEEEELRQFDWSVKLFAEIKDDFSEWFSRNSCNEDKKELKMFVARFSDVLDVEISCDGCGVTLPGRRYRCLQCDDMDLCTSCFSSGVEPEEHRDDHEIVHLVYKCNRCQAFIVGTRIHCLVCEDFDLCLGCHIRQRFPAGHTDKHEVTKIPMVTLKTSQNSNSSLKTYIHQHVWMLYTSLTLTLSDLVYGGDAAAYVDSDYIKMAGVLQQQCVHQATMCLDHVTREVDGESEKMSSPDSRRDQTFAIHSQERIMGLLGAVMPSGDQRDRVPGVGYNFWTRDFLDRFLRVSRGDNGYELNTQHLALRLLGRLLACGGIKGAVEVDDAVHNSAASDDLSAQCEADPDAVQKQLPSSPVKSSPTSSPTKLSPPTSLTSSPADSKKSVPSNSQIISKLFYFGTKSFEKSSVEWACSVARMLEMLSATPQWGPVVEQHVSHCVAQLRHAVSLSSIFPMFVIAGFPEVLTTGEWIYM